MVTTQWMSRRNVMSVRILHELPAAPRRTSTAKLVSLFRLIDVSLLMRLRAGKAPTSRFAQGFHRLATSARVLSGLACVLLVGVLAVAPARGETEGADTNELARLDALYEQGVAANDQPAGMDKLKEALDDCLKALERKPDDYEILWRCTRSAYKYGETAQALEVENWKEICKEWGKKGMAFAERAQTAEPERVEGHFWITACIGIYSDATGPFTAIKEGFYEKSKAAMKKAYDVDKSYNDYDPVFGSAMFYIALPFPLKDKKKALEYYREFERDASWSDNVYVRRVRAADLLMSVKPKGYKDEARALLEKARAYPRPQPYYQEWVRKLSKKLN